MPFIYSKVAALKDQDKVGSHQCVALLQFYAHLPNTGSWKPGATVLGKQDILPGTAIATFVKGRYRSRSYGNHAAFFLRHEGNGFVVMDQWKDKPGEVARPISERFIRSLNKPQKKDGSWPQASDNADAYSIIELK